MGKEIIFSSDYIEIVTCEYDTMIYTPVYSEKEGLYLRAEDEKPIKNITLLNSNLLISYLSGKSKLVNIPIMSVTAKDSHLKRRINEGILGTLLRYSIIDAQNYELDIEKSFDYEIVQSKIRKRSL